MERKPVKRGEPATKALRRFAHGVIKEQGGDKAAAERLGIGRATLSRLLAGQDLSPGTLAILEREMAAAGRLPEEATS